MTLEILPSIEFNHFSWRKADKGYELNEGPSKLGDTHYSYLDLNCNQDVVPFITQKPNTESYIGINPLKDVPALFAEFAEIDYEDNNAILNFANSYGLLLSDSTRQNRTGKIYLDQFWLQHAEKLDLWIDQIWLIKQTFKIWQWLLNNNKEQLESVITITNTDIVYKFLSSNKSWRISKQNGTQKLFDRLVPNNYSLPAKAFVQMIINKQLSNMNIKEYTEPPVKPCLLFNDRNELDQYLQPTSLLASMWLQFFQYVSGERKIKQCEICRKWIDVTQSNKNWTSCDTCVTSDKVRKHRKFPTVKKLIYEGMTIEEISLKLNVDSRDIKRWLAKEAAKNAKQNP